MKTSHLLLSSILAISTLAGCANVAAVDNGNSSTQHPSKTIKAPYPAAKAGYVQKTIHLPKTANDYDHKLELIVGKNQLVDCNRHSLGGQLVQRTLQGWGYNYWEAENAGPGMSTMMGCMGRPKEMKFVRMQPKLIRYNSKLPVHVYIPKGYELRYRVWSAGVEKSAP